MKSHSILHEPHSLPNMLARHPLIQLLNPLLTPLRYEVLLRLMLQHNYGRVGAFDEAEKCVGLSGFWLGTNLYSGKYLEADNFVVNEAHRSAGYKIWRGRRNALP